VAILSMDSSARFTQLLTTTSFQISDLLAQISGDKPSPASATVKMPASSAGIKRKADGTSYESKVAKARLPDGSGADSSMVRKPSKSNLQGAKTISTSSSSSGYAGTAAPNRPMGNPAAASTSFPRRDGLDSASRQTSNASLLGASKNAPVKSSTRAATASDYSKAPKKGSFAEIMARGAAAQQVMPRAGMIQHKALPKLPSKKERLEEKVMLAKGHSAARKPTGYAGVSKPSARGPIKSQNGARPAASGARRLNGGGPRVAGSSSNVPEKKVKKAALATTGYTGTSRPAAPAASRSSAARNGHKPSPRAGGLLAPPRYKQRDEEDEYDEEMDDFIDDDEDEELPYGMERRPQYDYDSEGSSDMEAGADDIYLEETRAERMARDEDRKEEARLERLRREKEARKRGAY
jgi:protein SPT2